MTSTVLENRSGDVLTVTLNRPEARNALMFEMYERLADIFAAVADSPDAPKAIILTGAGEKAFAAGTDIAQFRSFETAEHAISYERNMDDVLTTIERCRIPTIAAISGFCTGGGAAIVTACDIRIATQDMRFGFPISRTLGNCLSAANLARMSALIGAGRTREIIFTSRLMAAQEALDCGLVSELLPDHASLMARAAELAATLSGNAPLTLYATKETLRRLALDGAKADDEDMIKMCYLSEDFREGIDAFLSKRKPAWKGR